MENIIEIEHLYKSFGFAPSGEMNDEETLYERNLAGR